MKSTSISEASVSFLSSMTPQQSIYLRSCPISLLYKNSISHARVMAVKYDQSERGLYEIVTARDESIHAKPSCYSVGETG